MVDPLSPGARKVRDALARHGFAFKVMELPQSTRTAPEAAEAVGCGVEQIAKSLIFKGKSSGRAVLAIASGGNMVDVKKISGLFGEPIGKADADFVKQETGFAIGGVPPAGHAKPLATFIDEDLFAHKTIWAAAGSPNALFELTASELKTLTGGRVVDLKKESHG